LPQAAAIRIDGEKDGVRAVSGKEIMNTDASSADYMLSDQDYDEFRRGRSKDEILLAVQWRGNLEMATEYDGSSICAISYGIFGGPFGQDPRADIIWAIFVDDKFEKFVPWPNWFEKGMKVGNFSPLIRALEAEPISISDLRKVVDTGPAAPSQTNPGLTAAWLLLRKGVGTAHERDIKNNVELRDQFNAARLKIGMTESDVESALRATPIES
jgi:hypothetical protein